MYVLKLLAKYDVIYEGEKLLACFFLHLFFLLETGYHAVENGKGYCKNTWGKRLNGNDTTIQSCMQHCLGEYNATAFAFWMKALGHTNNVCECVKEGQDCDQQDGRFAINYNIVYRGTSCFHLLN